MPKKITCLTCDNKPYCRGLCWSCYSAARGKINSGETTDEKLVQLGLMAPAKQRGRRAVSGFSKAFAKK